MKRTQTTTTPSLIKKVRKSRLSSKLSTPSKDEPNASKQFVVRLYDGFDNQWCDITGPISKAEADKVWNEKTNKGTKAAKYSDIDYYAIFPADTKMVFSDGFGEH